MDGIERITGATKLACLIGSPVAHSASPRMHNASFARMGVDAVYLAFDVAPEELETVAAALVRMKALGYNVTMPHKAAILPLLDEVSDAAHLMGAVNTVRIEPDGRTSGHNTDGAGFMRNLAEHGCEVEGKRVVVLGAGGAGSALFVQAALDGAAHVDVFNSRSPRFAPAEERAAKTSALSGCPVAVHDLADRALLRELCLQADVIANATSVGMSPHEDESLLDEGFIPHGAWVADAVYNPRETKLLRTAKALGNPTVPGIGMILWQGAIAEEIWLGRSMDVDYIRNLLF